MCSTVISFSLFQFKTVASHQYLEPGTFKYIYLYHHRTQAKQLWGLFIPGLKRATVFVVDTVRSNQLPSLPALYNSERSAFMAKPDRTAAIVPEADHVFEVVAETDVKRVYRQIGRLLAAYMQVYWYRILSERQTMFRTVLRSRTIFPRLLLQVTNFGSGSTHNKHGYDRLLLQKTDFVTTHMKNLNFNKKASINLDLVPKMGKKIDLLSLKKCI